MSKKLWVLYDGRAAYDVDAASILCTAHSLKEAKQDRREMFPGAVIYEYDVKKGNVLVNERRVR